MKKLISLLLITAACAVFAGCSGAEKADSPKGFTLQYQEQTLTLQTPPKRVAVLTTPLLNMVYAAGGESVSRPTTRSPIPEAARSLPELGQTQHIDMEKLVALTPDLVLGERSQNRKLESLLQSNHLHYFLINYDGINDNVPLIRFLGRLYGTEEKTDALITEYESRIAALEEEAARHTPVRAAVLRATGKDVTAETDASICASMVKRLKMDNVVTAHKEISADAKTVPYSLEQLSADDPDLIFVVTMGNASEINKKMDEEMRSNPAWSQLKAVRTGRVYFLPYELFLMNPGLRTPEAMEQLLRLAYPPEN